jgi:hypothetical protein
LLLLPELDPDGTVFMETEGFGGAVDMEPSAPGSKVSTCKATAGVRLVFVVANLLQNRQPFGCECSNGGHRLARKLYRVPGRAGEGRLWLPELDPGDTV